MIEIEEQSVITYRNLVLEAKDRNELLQAIAERNASGNYPLIFTSSDQTDDYIDKNFKYAIYPSFDINDYNRDFDETIDLFIEACNWCGEQFGDDAIRSVVCSADPNTHYAFEEVDLSAAWAFNSTDFVMYFNNERDAVLYKTMRGF